MLPEKWLVKTNGDKNHPVLKYLNEKYSASLSLAGIYLYYGLNKDAIVF